MKLGSGLKWLADVIIADLGGVFALRGLDGYTL